MGPAVSFLVSLGVILASYGAVDFAHTRSQATTNSQAEVLYLPKGEHLELLSFGFQNVLSHTLWFNTINYFGEHFQKDRNYQWLGHMCDLVSRLNPKAKHVYEFCPAMLSWEANEPEKAVELLARAIEAYPDNWYYYYLRGFSYLYFLHDGVNAQKDLAMAATFPEAPSIVARIAQKKVSDLEDPNTVIAALVDMIKRAKDVHQRQALINHLKTLLAKVNQNPKDPAQSIPGTDLP